MRFALQVKEGLFDFNNEAVSADRISLISKGRMRVANRQMQVAEKTRQSRHPTSIKNVGGCMYERGMHERESVEFRQIIE